MVRERERHRNTGEGVQAVRGRLAKCVSCSSLYTAAVIDLLEGEAGGGEETGAVPDWRGYLCVCVCEDGVCV